MEPLASEGPRSDGRERAMTAGAAHAVAAGRHVGLALGLVFFVSGASALLFETLWFRLVGLALGNSVWATSLVLASFMAGLALGSHLVRTSAPSLRRPLRAYALLEVAIGASGLALVVGLPALTGHLAALMHVALDNEVALNGLRMLVAGTLLVVPATAMGATLPLLVQTLSAADPAFGSVLGRLYGWNTLGAVAGALAGEAFLIELLGVQGTGLVAAALNGVAAASALALSRRHPGAAPAPVRFAIGPRAWGVLGAAFGSGGILLALEVVWFRFAILFVPSSGVTFAVMLAVVLAGIACGGFTAGWLLRRAPGAFRAAGAVALLAGVAVTLSYALVTPGAMVLSGIGAVVALSAQLSFAASFVSGMLFTLLGRLLQEHVDDPTQATALLTLANTLGALVGSLAGGLVVLPGLGMERALFALALGYGVVAASTVTAVDGAGRRDRLAVALAAGSFVVVVALFPFGSMRHRHFPAVLEPFEREQPRVVAMREGLVETAFYLEHQLLGEAWYYRLLTNGFSMTSSGLPARRYMSLFVHWPVAVHPAPRRALLISYGLGVTASALTHTRELETIDVVDISRDLLELNREVPLFPGGHPLDDPRVRVHVEDGRFFLLTARQQYDIITAEPPPPRNAGVVNLYSREFFELVRQRLAPGGIVTYWLPVYQLRPAEARSVIRGFCAAFSDCSLWSGAGQEWMLVGTRGLRGPVPLERLTRPWRDAAVRRELTAIGVERPEDLGALFLGDAAFLDEWTRGVAPLDDGHPHRISPWPMGRVNYAPLMDPGVARERFRQSAWMAALWPEELRTRTDEAFAVQGMLNRYLQDFQSPFPELFDLLRDTPLRSTPLILMGADDWVPPILARAEQRGVRSPMLHYMKGAVSLSERRFDDARAEFAEAARLDPGSPELLRYRILASMLARKRDETELLLDELRRHEGPESSFAAWAASRLDEGAATIPAR